MAAVLDPRPLDGSSAKAALGVMVAIATFIVVIAAAGGWWWHWRAAYSARVAALPTVPDLTGKPETLRQALAAAERRALASSGSSDTIAELGRLYHVNGFTAPAEACWELLHRLEPREARWCYYLADLRQTKGDDAGMMSWLGQTLTLAPNYAPAVLKLADWEFKTGQRDLAEHDYRRRLALIPRDPYARIGLARLALQRDQRAVARDLLAQTVRDSPAFSQAHNLYAEVLSADGNVAGANQQRFLGHLTGIAGRYREAEDPWLDELRAWCYDPSRLSLWASIDDATNYGDHGVALLERAIRFAPDDPRGYDELGRVYLRAGAAVKALPWLEQGVKLAGAPSDLYAALSETYRTLGRPKAALRATERGLAQMPNAADLHTARGLALEAVGRLAEAAAEYRRAADLAPDVSETQFNLGNALLHLGEPTQAEKCFKKALEINPTYPRALVVLGQGELEAGRLDEAAKYVRPLYEYYPGSVSARRLMTWWCLQSGVAAAQEGQPVLAEKRLKEGLAIDPELPELHGRLGLLYAETGRLPEALGELETYHRLRPSEPLASLLLAQAYASLGRTDDARRMATAGAQLARQSGDTATESRCAELIRRLSP